MYLCYYHCCTLCVCVCDACFYVFISCISQTTALDKSPTNKQTNKNILMIQQQNVPSDDEKTDNRKEGDQVQETVPPLEQQQNCPNSKENENLILMTQNYQKFFENNCECSSLSVPSKLLNNAKTNWMSSDKLNELRRKAHDAVRQHKVFILKGYFHTVRKALTGIMGNGNLKHREDIGQQINRICDCVFIDRGWVEKMDGHRIRGTMGASGFLLEDLVQALPPRQKGESKRA